MMKNLLFVYICLFGLALPLSAQKLDAQDILDRTATAFRQAGGIQADFTVQTYAKGVLQGSSVGTIRLKGEINQFRQHEAESLSDAWTRLKSLLRWCPNHGHDRVTKSIYFTQDARWKAR